jgi:adenosine deaminase
MNSNSKIFGNWNEIFPQWPHKISLPMLPSLPWQCNSQEEFEFATQVHEFPKAELHVHLEAATEGDFYIKLNKKMNIFSTEEISTNIGPFKNFHGFIMGWFKNLALLNSEDVYLELVKSFFRSREKQNIFYSEVHVSLIDTSLGRNSMNPFKSRVLSLHKSLEFLLKATHECEKEFPKIKVKWILDALYPSSPHDRNELLSSCVYFNKQGLSRSKISGENFVWGFGFGGPELPENIEDCAKFSESAKMAGYKIDCHSGETSTLKNHLRTLEKLQPDRVSHALSSGLNGVRIGQFVCANPISNVLTGVFQEPFSHHPIFKWLNEKEGGVSVSTDDPLLFGNNICIEWVAIGREIGFEKAWDLFEKTNRVGF